MIKVSSWGRLSCNEHQVTFLSDRLDAVLQIKGKCNAIAIGMGRSYGDVCLNPGSSLLSTRGLGRFIQFDRDSGLLHCDAGVLLRDIQRLAVPNGWMLPVSPGTQMVTLGGAIANDVHGKNHARAGTFGRHVKQLTLLRTNGEKIHCGPSINTSWFTATIGGLGLTGLISDAQLQLRPIKSSFLNVETIAFKNLDDFFSLTNASINDWEYSVAWLDCVNGGLGRGIFSRANHAEDGDLGSFYRPLRNFSVTPPFSMINSFTLRGFNELYFRTGQLKAGCDRIHYEPFFYPLDGLQNWNRLYGPKGFFQYQCVIPKSSGRQAIADLLREIAKHKQGSCLAVLKTFGAHDPVGLLSFPIEGVTLALDFPNLGDKTHQLFSVLDEIVASSGGRIYCAKDARMSKDFFLQSYSHISDFKKFRDPGLSSSMSRRLMDN